MKHKIEIKNIYDFFVICDFYEVGYSVTKGHFKVNDEIVFCCENMICEFIVTSVTGDVNRDFIEVKRKIVGGDI